MVRSRLRAVLAGLACALCPVVAAGQADVAVPRPEVKHDERWSYRRINLNTNQQTGSFETKVVHASERAILTVTENRGEMREIDQNWTAEWNQISTGDGAIFDPDSGLLRFPLRAGATYPVGFSVRRPRQGEFEVRYDCTATVVGWEEVDVPAGKFRALKVEVEGFYRRIDVSGGGKAKWQIWYAPAAKRWVKWMYEDSTPRGRLNWMLFELTAYSID